MGDGCLPSIDSFFLFHRAGLYFFLFVRSLPFRHTIESPGKKQQMLKST